MIPASPDMISCERLIELLLDYLEGDLEPAQQAAMEKHLEACPPCVDFAEQYRATPELCRKELVKRHMPAEMRSHLLTFLRDEIEG